MQFRRDSFHPFAELACGGFPAPSLHKPLVMFGRKPKPRGQTGSLDGGEGRGVPLGGHDERPPTGYRALRDQRILEDDELQDLLWDDGQPSDRRRDPLRR